MQTIAPPNINYTKLPREKVYRDRCNLDDFGVKDQKSIEKWMLECIYESEIIEIDDAEKYIIEIFNTAHYIATVLLWQQDPMMSFAWCINTAKKIGADSEHDNDFANELFVAITLAMVINYLKICDLEYRREGNMFVGRIEKWLKNHYDFYSSGLRLFKNAMNFIPSEVIHTNSMSINRDDFKPLATVLADETGVNDNVPQKDDKELSSRVKDLENENESLKETIREHQARVCLMTKKKDKRGGVQIGLTPEQCVVFGEYIAKELKITCKNKKRIAPLLNALFGWGTKSLSNKISGGVDKENKKFVADIFAHYSHEIARDIYPGWDESMLTPWPEFEITQ